MGTIKQINIKNRTYHFYTDTIDVENVDLRLLKLDKKSYKTLVSTILDILQLKKLVIVKIFTVLILCIYVLIMQADILSAAPLKK